MKRLLLIGCTFILLTACSTESDTTEEIIIINQPNPSNEKKNQEKRENTLYIKETEDNDE
ncbi:hypothetical protein [Sutcliffiella halmapala]|uniref:hypothetical protein n=1 Tax=Sutcliffiella halmapala TaxID=79882 RepID=UPI000994946D|nr:hypothetical protein [Sutcliffiella halmapala]